MLVQYEKHLDLGFCASLILLNMHIEIAVEIFSNDNPTVSHEQHIKLKMMTQGAHSPGKPGEPVPVIVKELLKTLKVREY